MHQEPAKWLSLLGIYPKAWICSLQNNWLLIKKQAKKRESSIHLTSEYLRKLCWKYMQSLSTYDALSKSVK
jgi:hypothetical protein